VSTATERPLSAPLDIGFDYTRSVGPVLGRFFTGLAQRSIEGIRGSDGRVHVPPVEYDPVTAAPLDEFVPVADEGTVISWSWVPEPRDGQPIRQPFAFALIRLDGADTALLHAVNVTAPEQVTTGMRVRAHWADEPVGHIRDIRWFDPVTDSPTAAPQESAAPQQGKRHEDGSVATIITPINLSYTHSASAEESRHLRGLAEGRLIGQRCPECGKIYIPPREACPTDGVPTSEDVELPDTGTVTTFCIVNVPFMGQAITPPYVSAHVLLDGADVPFQHLVLGCDASEVRMGMRVRASWKPEVEWSPTLSNIDHFEPTGEADAPYESFSHHL